MVTTDDASYGDIVFGLFAMLGYRSSRRFADLPNHLGAFEDTTLESFRRQVDTNFTVSWT